MGELDVSHVDGQLILKDESGVISIEVIPNIMQNIEHRYLLFYISLPYYASNAFFDYNFPALEKYRSSCFLLIKYAIFLSGMECAGH